MALGVKQLAVIQQMVYAADKSHFDSNDHKDYDDSIKWLDEEMRRIKARRKRHRDRKGKFPPMCL